MSARSGTTVRRRSLSFLMRSQSSLSLLSLSSRLSSSSSSSSFRSVGRAAQRSENRMAKLSSASRSIRSEDNRPAVGRARRANSPEFRRSRSADANRITVVVLCDRARIVLRVHADRTGEYAFFYARPLIALRIYISAALLVKSVVSQSRAPSASRLPRFPPPSRVSWCPVFSVEFIRGEIAI